MRLKTAAAAITTMAIVIGLTIFLRHKTQKPLEGLVIAVPPSILSAPLYVAAERGFFRKEGLEVTLKHVPAGMAAMDAAIAGEASFAVSPETPFMSASLSGTQGRIVATIADSDHDFGIIIKDGKQNLHDTLRNSRIGISPHTAGRLFLDRFLAMHDMESKDVSIITMKEEDFATAFAENRIEAACTRNPFLMSLKEKVGRDTIIFYSDWMYTTTWNLIGTDRVLRQRPQMAVKTVRALLRSVDYMYANPKESQAVTAKYLHIQQPYIASLWSDYHFEISLDQSLLLILENQARWAIRIQGGESTMPNFAKYIYPDALDVAAPENVTFIHRTVPSAD